MYQRHQRVESLIRDQLNDLILRELEFGGVLVTVTEVEVQKDLDYANIKVSAIPSEKSAEVVKLLEQNKKRLGHLLLRKINIKPMPELRFLIDVGMEKAAEVEKALLKIEKEEGGS
jgi:ribosome-binding factor A